MRNVQRTYHYENDVLQYIHEVLEELALRSSPVERDLYIRQLSNETGVSTEAITAAIYENGRSAGENSKSGTRSMQMSLYAFKMRFHPVRKTGTERAERLLLYHLLNDGALFDRIREDKPNLFVRDDYIAIFVRLAGFYEQHGTPDFHRFAEIFRGS